MTQHEQEQPDPTNRGQDVEADEVGPDGKPVPVDTEAEDHLDDVEVPAPDDDKDGD